MQVTDRWRLKKKTPKNDRTTPVKLKFIQNHHSKGTEKTLRVQIGVFYAFN
jgi:hypothetical protein